MLRLFDIVAIFSSHLIFISCSFHRGLELNASVKDKKGIPTKYNYKVKKLPGEINPSRSSVEVTLSIVDCYYILFSVV